MGTGTAYSCCDRVGETARVLWLMISHLICTAMQSDLLELNGASVVGWGSPHEAECLILDSGLSPVAMSDRDLCRNTVT